MKQRYKLINSTQLRRIAHAQDKHVGDNFSYELDEYVTKLVNNMCNASDKKKLKFGQMSLF